MSKALIQAGWQDVPHLDEATKADILASTPSHLRDARTKGIPTLGSGAVYPVDPDSLKVAPFALPRHWPRVAGIDFGWDHPTGVVWMAWDRDADTLYLYDAFQARQTAIPMIASAIKARGEWIPVAWPHDGYAADGKRDGKPIRDLYAAEGVRMMAENATHATVMTGGGATSVEAGVLEIYTAMLEGRFKVFNHLNDWFSEMQTYHRKDGKIVKIRDDLMDAGRYAWMMRRGARVEPIHDPDRPKRVRSWKTA